MALLTIFLLCTIGIVLGLYLLRKRNLNERGLGHIPGPPTSNLLLGNSAELRDPVTRVATIGRWRQEYGPVFKLTGGIFMLSEVILVDPDVEFVVMKMPDKGEGFWPFKWFIKYVCHAEVTFVVDGEVWSQRRKEIMHKGFTSKDLPENFRVLDETLRRAMHPLRVPTHAPTDIHQFASAVFLDSMSQTLFGTPLGALTDPTNSYISCFEGIVKEMAIVQSDPLHFFKPRTLSLLYRIQRGCMEYAQGHMDARRNFPEKFETARDVCSKALQGGVLDERAVAHEMTGALIASSGNPSLSVSWLLYTLVQNPDIKARVEQEVQRVVGSKPCLEYEDLAAMKYLDLVVQETFRMFIPDAIHRRTTTDLTLHGYDIPKGTQVWIPSFLSHFEKVGEDPYTFNPERFNTETHIRIHPFGGGPRICLGHMWTKMAVKAVVATLLHNFHVSLDPLNPPVVPEFHMLLFESERIKLIFQAKDQFSNSVSPG